MMLMSVDKKDSESNWLIAEQELPVSVLVVDDHPVVRMGIALLLGQASQLNLIGEASDCAQGWELIKSSRPGILVVDLMLGDGTACDLMGKMQAANIESQVIVYTAHGCEARVLEALRAGANGYVVKGSPPERLIDAIHNVANGGSYLDPAIASRVIGRVGRVQERRAAHSRELTEREATVLSALVEGKRNKDIARELFITERTVKYHLNGLFIKLRVKNRTQAVRVAIEQGLISV